MLLRKTLVLKIEREKIIPQMYLTQTISESPGAHATAQ